MHLERQECLLQYLVHHEHLRLLRQKIARRQLIEELLSEPASELLKRIKAEKEQLIKEGKIKKDKTESYIFKGEDNKYYEQIGSKTVDITDEIPFEIPQGWEWCRLGEIGLSNIGLTYKPADISTEGVIVLRSSNIQNNKIDLNDIVRVNVKIENHNLLVKTGDIIICARNGSKNLVGKCAIINNISEEMTFGAFMAIFRTQLNLWTKAYLDSPLFRKTLSSVNTVTIN